VSVMRCQTFDAPLGAMPVMTLLGSVQTTTLVVVMINLLTRISLIIKFQATQ